MRYRINHALVCVCVGVGGGIGRDMAPKCAAEGSKELSKQKNEQTFKHLVADHFGVPAFTVILLSQPSLLTDRA